jgi:hypothetical protein
MAPGFGTTATYQFFRTERWLGRIEAIYNGKYVPVGNSDDVLDHILAFFLNCCHIKDWLQNGPEWHDDVDPKLKKMAIEQFVTESPALCICTDLCNGNKHFRVDKRPLRSGSVPELHRVHCRVDITAEEPLKTNSYTFRTERGLEDAYTLALECFESWKLFIRESTTESFAISPIAIRSTSQAIRIEDHGLQI